MGNDHPQLSIRVLIDPRLEFVSIMGPNVTLRVLEPMGIAERGHLLLETEKLLRREVDDLLEVFLEPREDKNYMRLLRGVEETG